MPPAATRLQLQPRSSVLAFGDGEPVTLPVGPQSLAEAVLRHDPPTPAELEGTIDHIEDALTASRLARADRGELRIDDALLRTLPGLGATGSQLTRDGVEALFGKLASRSLGTPVSAAELPPGRKVAAALVILRECMHHLGFERVVVSEARPA